MAAIYRLPSLNQMPLVYVDRRTSELIKYASNAFLAVKITFINEMATDDMREAPALSIIAALQDAGAAVRGYDPESIEQARPLLRGVEFAANAYECAAGADAGAILTEWDEFRALDLARLKATLKAPVLVDLRNIYPPEDARRAGFEYRSVGRPQP